MVFDDAQGRLRHVCTPLQRITRLSPTVMRDYCGVRWRRKSFFFLDCVLVKNAPGPRPRILTVVEYIVVFFFVVGSDVVREPRDANVLRQPLQFCFGCAAHNIEVTDRRVSAIGVVQEFVFEPRAPRELGRRCHQSNHSLA